jgi:chlorite dismutase
MTAEASIETQTYIQALALALDPAWRRRTDAERHDDGCRFLEAEATATVDGVRTVTYSTIGLEPGVDILLWRMAPSVEQLEGAAAGLAHRYTSAGRPPRSSRCSTASGRATWSSTRSPRAPTGISCPRRRGRA